MQSVNVTERFRRARIAFIVPEGDPAAFERSIRLNTTLLGGKVNPIVTYSAKSQTESVAMLRAFDPDLLHFPVELPKDWIPAEVKRSYPDYYTTLFFPQPNGRSWLQYQDILPMISFARTEHVRGTEPRFYFPITVPGSTSALFYATLYGAYPSDFDVDFERTFRERLRPFNLSLPPELPSLYVISKWDVITPIELTVAELEAYSGGRDHPRMVIFVGEPTSVVDLTDYWNVRAAGNIALFIPISTFDQYRSQVESLGRTDAGPALMDHASVIYSRTASDKQKTDFEAWLSSLFSNRSVPEKWDLTADFWNRTPPPVSKYHYRSQSQILVAPNERGDIEYHSVFPQWLEPTESFAVEQFIYVDTDFRTPSRPDRLVTSFPRDPGVDSQLLKWSSHNGRVTSAGLSFLRSPTWRHTRMHLPTSEELVAAIFKHRTFTIKLSEPGKVTKQILLRLGGIEGCRVFKVPAVREVLELLNDGKAHPHNEVIAKIGRNRADCPSIWVEPQKHIEKYNSHELLDLMYRLGMIQQGWKLQCHTCSKYDWYPVSALGEVYACRYCFSEHPTPLLVYNTDVAQFSYRANGLYQTENKMGGSVPVIVSLWPFAHAERLGACGFTTSVEVRPVDSTSTVLGELDFLVVMAPSGAANAFDLVFGESRNRTEFTSDDIQKTRRLADLFGASFVAKHLTLCFTTLKTAFSDDEKRLLNQLVQEGYRIIPMTKLDLDRYDVYERFPRGNQPTTSPLDYLADGLRKLNLS
jgi:hypothetical protein